MSEPVDPLIYHTHQCLHSEDLPFWLELARKQSGPVLEFGCGSGRVASYLSAAGFQVVGLDNNYEMLAFIRRNSSIEWNERITIIQSDFTRFHLAARFKLIIMPCNTYSTLSQPHRLEVLSQIRRHLLPTGTFALQITNPSLLIGLPKNGETEIEDVFTLPFSGDAIQVSSSWKRTPKELAINWYYDQLLTNGKIIRSKLSLSHTLESPQVYRDEISKQGLHILQELGDYDFSPYQDDSPVWIILVCPL